MNFVEIGPFTDWQGSTITQLWVCDRLALNCSIRMRRSGLPVTHSRDTLLWLRGEPVSAHSLDSLLADLRNHVEGRPVRVVPRGDYEVALRSHDVVWTLCLGDVLTICEGPSERPLCRLTLDSDALARLLIDSAELPFMFACQQAQVSPLRHAPFFGALLEPAHREISRENRIKAALGRVNGSGTRLQRVAS